MTEDEHHVIHLAVGRHAVETPAAPAVVTADEQVSYATLDAAARSYAADLRSQGVGPGAIVALTIPRSVQLVAVQLGVLKCGAAYANVDLRWPSERIKVVMELLDPALVVVRDNATDDGFPGTERHRVDDVRTAAARAESFVAELSSPTAPATLFFTSGTTGRPKAVVSPHVAITRMFRPGGLDGFGPGHATPQSAPLPWDMYAFEVWGQLVSGGTTVLVDQEFLMPGTLRDLIALRGVDTLWLTASLFNLFVDEDVGCFEGLTHVLIGGEKLSPAHVRQFLERHPQIPLRNGYGPAENCMLTTTHLLTLDDCALPAGVPVGIPVLGTSVYVLDANDLRCPVGEAGEVCIAGLGLACGYLHDPELTALKFCEVEIDGVIQRVYRTGDVGLFDAAGQLHFRGRVDRQVKISGHRIELEEIEAAARGVDGVRSCAVLPVTGPDGQVSGIALFYTAEVGDEVPADAEIRAGLGEENLSAHLQRTLPSYMVPRLIQRIDRFPVTPNGKVDSAALMAMARPARRRSPRASRERA